MIAEYSHVRHHDQTTQIDYSSQAFYVQAAYRFPSQPKWKRYARIEKLIGRCRGTGLWRDAHHDRHSRRALRTTDRGRAQGRDTARRDGSTSPDVNGLYLQVAFTF